MSRIIANPDRLINALATSFGEDLCSMLATIFDQYISDAVIAVDAEDIAAQAIAWAISHNEFYHEVIDRNIDFARLSFVQDFLIKELDMEAIIDQIQNDWDMNSSVSGEAICEALFTIYNEPTILNLVSLAAAQKVQNHTDPS